MAWEVEAFYARNQNQRDILVAIPHTGRVSFDFAANLAMLQPPPNTSMAISGNTGQPIDIARNIFASKALQMQCQYIFYVDSDMILKAGTLVELWNERMPIVSACYLNRGPPYELVANIGNKPVSHNIMQEQPNKLVEVEEVGMGSCLIDTRVFQRLAQRLDKWHCIRPHGDNMDVVSYKNNEAIQQNYKCTREKCEGLLLCNFFDHKLGKGEYLASEDYWFCRQVRELGFQVYLKTSVFVTHETAPWKLTETGLENPISSAGIIQ